MVRCFEDLDVIYSEGDVNNLDPITEMEDVQTELILSDLEICARKNMKKGLTPREIGVWSKVYKQLDNGEPVRTLEFNIDEAPIVAELPLITAKPLLFACNVGTEAFVDGSPLADQFIAYAKEKYPGTPTVVLSSLLEDEIVQIKQSDGQAAAEEYMELSGLEESVLDQLLEECSNILGLQKFYTAGETHVSSWFIKRGATAPQAAGAIHTAFEKAFICAEVSKVEDWLNIGDEEALRRKNKWQRYGKEYIMQENDVVIFKHNK